MLGTLAASGQDSPANAPVIQAAPEIKLAPKRPTLSAAAKPTIVKETAAAQQKPAPSAATSAAKSVAGKGEPPPSDPFAGVPADEKLAIQSALLWSGDYTGTTAGEDPMLTAIKNFQKRSKTKVTGTLTADERAKLVAAARNHEQEFGWRVVVDPATGVRIGLPTKLTPIARDAARGTRWSSAHGEIQVETFRIKTTDLAALFEKEKKEPATRKVATSALHPDNFFISGMQGLKIFSVKAQLHDGEVRGFTMLYDQAMEGIVAPVMVAMASAFSPFPERHSAPYAELAKPVEYGSGLIVSSLGHIVTDRKLTQGCQVLVAKGIGDAERIADDPESGLALLRVYGAHELIPLPLALGAPKSGDVTLIGMPDPKDQDGRKPLSEIKARLAGTAIELREPAPMAGFSGAAALDASGKFLGMAEMGSGMLASATPSLAPLRLISAQTIRAFLEARDVAAATNASADARRSVVRVICVRK